MSKLNCYTRKRNDGSSYITCNDKGKVRKRVQRVSPLADDFGNINLDQLSPTSSIDTLSRTTSRMSGISNTELDNDPDILDIGNLIMESQDPNFNPDEYQNQLLNPTLTEEEDNVIDDIPNPEDLENDNEYFEYPTIPQQNTENGYLVPLLESNELLDYGLLPMDLSRGSTQRRVEAEDRRQDFLQESRRDMFLEDDRKFRRESFLRTLSKPNEFTMIKQKPKVISGSFLDKITNTQVRGSGILNDDYLDYMYSKGLPKFRNQKRSDFYKAKKNRNYRIVADDGSQKELRGLVEYLESGGEYKKDWDDHYLNNNSHLIWLNTHYPKMKLENKRKPQQRLFETIEKYAPHLTKKTL